MDNEEIKEDIATLKGYVVAHQKLLAGLYGGLYKQGADWIAPVEDAVASMRAQPECSENPIIAHSLRVLEEFLEQLSLAQKPR